MSQFPQHFVLARWQIERVIAQEDAPLVKNFRANEATKDTPMIVLSTKEEPAVKAEAFALGANDYVVKLPDRLELLARIRYHSKGYIAQLQRNEAYQALHDLGAREDECLFFRRTRNDVRIATARHVHHLQVRLSSDELRMHAALDRYTQALAHELFEHEIFVNCMAPTSIVLTSGAEYVRDIARKNPDWVEPVEMMAEGALELCTGRHVGRAGDEMLHHRRRGGRTLDGGLLQLTREEQVVGAAAAHHHGVAGAVHLRVVVQQ